MGAGERDHPACRKCRLRIERNQQVDGLFVLLIELVLFSNRDIGAQILKCGRSRVGDGAFQDHVATSNLKLLKGGDHTVIKERLRVRLAGRAIEFDRISVIPITVPERAALHAFAANGVNIAVEHGYRGIRFVDSKSGISAALALRRANRKVPGDGVLGHGCPRFGRAVDESVQPIANHRAEQRSDQGTDTRQEDTCDTLDHHCVDNACQTYRADIDDTDVGKRIDDKPRDHGGPPRCRPKCEPAIEPITPPSVCGARIS